MKQFLKKVKFIKKNILMGWKPFVEGLETMVLNHGFKPFSREEVHYRPSLERFETMG